MGSSSKQPTCSHKFVDSKVCLRCGRTPAQIRMQEAAERMNPEQRRKLARTVLAGNVIADFVAQHVGLDADAGSSDAEPPTPRERPPKGKR